MLRHVLAHKRNAEPTTGADWLSKRRREVGALPMVPKGSATDNVIDEQVQDTWTNAHEQEARRQRAVRKTRAREAVQAGVATMVGANVTAQDTEAFTREERKRQHELEVKWKRDAKVVQPKENKNLRGLCVFVDTHILNNDPEAAQRLVRQSHHQSFRRAQDRSLADVVVVADPIAPGERNEAVAILRGGLLCSPGYIGIAPRTAPKVAISFQRGLQLPRCIFVTSEVARLHGGMVDLLKKVSATVTGGRWRWFNDTAPERQRFLTTARARQRVNHTAEVATLVTSEEKNQPAFRTFVGRRTVREFIQSIRRVEQRFTHQGFCGR